MMTFRCYRRIALKNPLDSKLSQNLSLFLARVPLGVYLVLDGYLRVQRGVGSFASSHQFETQRFIGQAAAYIFLHAFPFLELAAGAFLALGLFSRIGGVLASVLLLTVVAVFTGIAGSGNAPFNPFIILLGLAILLSCAGSGSLSVDRFWGRNKKTAH